ncbi:methylenetetrahydrofolate reductase [NAD(P)H] [Lignipirellula cremea]|uniref:Methylenetetrahydrofolate reductase n=1 Tax=Lignipirellula cremea TaxID=2528010 RepID=A0A518E0Z5_9BACT|nr:methylenetetrahydrofolate reductase [NAD(P)H] [Lignipirellula cremea]QDU97744.1 5,10-methylenetetrahydrofolate reductase [Lignipirellula cremea]
MRTQLAACYQPGRLGLSFELFPPRTAKGDESLFEHVADLMQFSPDFLTCTYGAGGSTRNKTLEIVEQVKDRFKAPVASHLTVVGGSIEELRDYLQEAGDRGVDYIVALRGDPPKGETEFRQAPGGLRYANELVDLIRSEYDHFGVAVAGYPEVHQEAESAEVDLLNLKRKVESGADVVITQLFYDNADFWRFREQYQQAGITVPLVPGILPVTNLAQIQRITALCGAQLPESFVARLNEHPTDDDWQFQVGVEFAVQQVQELIDGGAPGIHFYVLNKSQATSAVLQTVRRTAM